MYTLSEMSNMDNYIAFINNKKPFASEFLMIQSKIYKIKIDKKVKKDIININGVGNIVDKINVNDYNITEVINLINIDIIKSSKNEINEEELRTNIYTYLKDLFVFDTMKFKINDTELLVYFTKSFDKYYLINDTTKIIINNNKHKLYNNIIDINDKTLLHIILNISHVSGSFKRNLLDDIYLLNNCDFDIKLQEVKHSLYINKSFNFFSNNCEFNAKISFMKIILDDKDKLKSSDSIFNFSGESGKRSEPDAPNQRSNSVSRSFDFDNVNKQYIFAKNIYINENKINCSKITFIIKDGPKEGMIYDVNKVKIEICNALKFNYIKTGDVFKILVDNDLLTLQIYHVDDTVYIDDLTNTTIAICEDTTKRISVYDLNKVHNIKSMDVIIQEYWKSHNLSSLFGGKKDDTIPEIDINKIHLTLKNIYYFLYSEKSNIQISNSFTFKFDNIIVDKCDNPPLRSGLSANNSDAVNLHFSAEKLDNCILRICYDTKFNIINEESNLKIINDSISSSKINMTMEDIKNITTKLEELGISGMDDQINKIVKEILLPRSEFYDESFKKFIKVPKGIILYGPPGTGKTTLARNLVKIIGIPDYRINMINGTSIFSKWLGESEQNIRNLFEKPRKDKKNLYVLIIDEVDAIFKSRDTCDSTKSDVVNQFLGEMDGLVTISNILIIGITNRINSLDPAILRPGRFSSKIYCGLPDDQSRLNIIKLYHNRLTSVKFDDIDFDNMVTLTKDFSGAEIEYVYVKIIELLIEGQFNKTEIIITNEMINDIIKQIK
jgi:SpoVK/Ycf46/Vps4 family AAA+-type ATPase